LNESKKPNRGIVSDQMFIMLIGYPFQDQMAFVA